MKAQQSIRIAVHVHEGKFASSPLVFSFRPQECDETVSWMRAEIRPEFEGGEAQQRGLPSDSSPGAILHRKDCGGPPGTTPLLYIAATSSSKFNLDRVSSDDSSVRIRPVSDLFAPKFSDVIECGKFGVTHQEFSYYDEITSLSVLLFYINGEYPVNFELMTSYFMFVTYVNGILKNPSTTHTQESIRPAFSNYRAG